MSDLLALTRRQIASALASGLLEPLSSAPVAHEDAGVPFFVRRLLRIPRKPSGHAEGATDPFLPPYLPDLFVADCPPEHAILLNRYPVLEDHLLVVTRQWQDQERPPAPSDLAALDAVLDEIDGLGFYNGGALAGASQPHRHLQIVPRQAFGPGGLPLEAQLRRALEGGGEVVEGWPYRHAIAQQVGGSAATFASLWERTGVRGPFSLLCTREWMLLVPRSASHVAGIPINSLAYMGSLVVKDAEQQAHLERVGAWRVLMDAAFPRT